MAELKLTIGADVKPAEQALKSFVSNVAVAETAVQEFSTESARSAAAFANLGSAFAKSAAQISSTSQGAVKAIKEIDLTVETLRAKIAARKDFILTEKDLTKIAQYNKEIESLESVLHQIENTGKTGFWGGAPLDKLTDKTIKAGNALSKLPNNTRQANSALINLARVAQDAPFGFIAIQNNLTELLPSFQRLRQESGSTGAALKSFFGSLAGVGGIGLAFSILTSIMTVMSLRSRETKEETEKLSKTTSEAEEKQKHFAQAIDKAASSIIGQAKEIKNLREIILSTTSSLEDLTQATINQGVARFIFDEKNVTLQKALNALIEKEVLLKKKSGKAGVLGAPEFLTDAATESIRLFEKTAAEAQGLSFVPSKDLKRLDELNKILGESSGELRGLNALAGDLSKFFKGFLDGSDKSKKTAEDFINKAKQLAAELEKIGFIQPQFSFFDTIEEQLVKARKVFDDFNNKRFRLNPDFFKIEGGFNIPPAEVEKVLNAIEEGLKKGIIERGSIDISVPVSITTDFSQNAELIRDFTSVFQDIGKNIPPIDLTKTAGFNRNLLVQQLRDFFKVGEDVTEDGLRQMAEAFARGISQINNSISNLKSEGIATIGEAIGSVLSGGEIGDAFRGFAGAIASAIQAIGKQFIALGAVAVAAKKSLASLFANPVATIAVGTALVAIGAAFRNLTSKGITGFAEGGLVFGPTIGLVGEGVGTSRSNPEVIAPLDQLKGMLGSLIPTPSRSSGRSYVRGKDIVLVAARTNASQGRLGVK